MENENSGSDVIKLNATPSYLKPDGDDVEVRERWTPTPEYRACESAHANKHLVRCEARRYEYRLKYGRNPSVTTRRVYHEPETVPEGTAHGVSETNPKAGAGSTQHADSEMQLLAGCHSRRRRRVLQESPISSRGQIPRHLPGLLGRQTTP